MSEDKVMNINEDELSEKQQVLIDRAKAVLEVCEQEPAMLLKPYLRFTEDGVLPDVRLVLKDEFEPSDEGKAEETGEESGEGQPDEPQDKEG